MWNQSLPDSVQYREPLSMRCRSLPFVLLPVLVVGLPGCQTAQTIDFNDPANASLINPESMQIAIRGIYDSLEFRRKKGQITQAKLDEELLKRSREYAKAIDLESIPPAEAWRAGDVYRTAKMWKEGKRAYEIAAKNAATSDRVTDARLRLAQCQAELGEYKPALANAFLAFEAAPGDKGAILPACLYEIAPPLKGKGHDVALAELLAAAIEQHMATDVDATTRPGATFLAARSHHISKAATLSAELFRKSNRPRTADRTLRRAQFLIQYMKMSSR